MIKLRPYQQIGVEEIRRQISSGYRRILYQLPCGGGKTIIGAFITLSALSKNNTLKFIVHRRELLKQTLETFKKFDIPVGTVSSGNQYDKTKPVHICSIDTLKNRLDKINVPKIVIIDECHHANAKGWQQTIEHFYNSGSVIIGLTATPCRLDGKPLNQNFDCIVCGPDYDELINTNALTDYDYYNPPRKINFTGIKSNSSGDYTLKDLEERTNKRYVIGDAVKNYMSIAAGKQCITFCPSVKTAEAVADAYNDAGVPAACISGAKNRDRLISEYKNGIIKVLTNVNIVTEGFDVPCCEVVQLLRKTQSLSLYIQMVWRGGRIEHGKKSFIVLDHVGNYEMHGAPDKKREWSLSGNYKPKQTEELKSVKQCPKCFYVIGDKKQCPRCGNIAVTIREVQEPEVVQAELEKIERDKKEQQEKRNKFLEEKNAETLDDFLKIQKQRGYKPGWAKIRHSIRKQRLKNV